MNKKRTTIYILAPVIVLLIIVTGILFLSQKNKIKREKRFSDDYMECDQIHYPNAPIEPTDKLNDPNEVQLIHAMKNGLKKPFATNQELFENINKLEQRTILVKVAENRFYQLKSLTHSQPYLIPEAIDMLNEIGYRFQKQLKKKGYDNFRFRITSILRTGEDQNNLCHRNRNATKSISCHLYGTTVDISYKNFYNTRTDTIEASYEAVQTLTRVLQELRRECKIMAVRERHQSCFHITVVLCQPPKNKINYLTNNENPIIYKK